MNVFDSRPRLLLLLAVVLLLGSSLQAHAQALQYYNVPPCRAVDTRAGAGTPMSSGVVRDFTLKGVCGIPNSPSNDLPKLITFNVTVVSPTDTGFLVIWPTGGVYPPVSLLNFTGGDSAIANGGISQVATSTPDLSAVFGTCCGVGTIHLIIDVTGYFK